MILAVTTSITCDDENCTKCCTVSVFPTGQTDASTAAGWFCGPRLAFCPRCRVRVRNQDAIATEESALMAAAPKVIDFTGRFTKEETTHGNAAA